MKILFLDIDGVLNSYQSAQLLDHVKRKDGDFPEFFQDYVTSSGDMCPLAISNLEYILETVKTVQIVISSTWRHGCTLRDLKNYFKMSPLIQSRIIDSTPSLRDAQRGDEIKRWVYNSTRPVHKFAVLDDDTDMNAVMDDFFHVNHKKGLDWCVVEEVIRHFGS